MLHCSIRSCLLTVLYVEIVITVDTVQGDALGTRTDTGEQVGVEYGILFFQRLNEAHKI